MPAEQPISIKDLLALQLALTRYESVSVAVPNLQGDVRVTLEKFFRQHGKYTHMKNLSAAIDGQVKAKKRTSGDPT
ncbi:hypothetical protein A2881_03160 [Candidatus Peribacteria bacterium RIFCSPHIGHO2_01_FULL_55_13]|nr:MAG: hypothetical protein A2881_03160 [Candidatus Peribacteria bacterium RIFCSPHIGHO2_01_FULL_55_13]OGJ65992.1 MAG: hypothetical protein A3F36_04755 [Candidatus Peribacteria bacterium RIFCSPHIGHO2_12_FULL_55_11]